MKRLFIICGMAFSGKTTLAKRLCCELGCAHVYFGLGHSFSGAATLLICAHLRCITCGVDVLLSTHRFQTDPPTNLH
jgi:molybdopterin-guanine dinucleotide biosynthesis protein